MEDTKKVTNPKKSNDLLDFMLDKTHQTYYETGRALSHAFLTYLILVSIEILLVFGMGADENVSIPLLQVTLKRQYAAIVMLVLSCLALYWLCSLRILYFQVGYRLFDLMHERYGYPSGNLWFIQYPLPMWAVSPLVKASGISGLSVPRSLRILSNTLLTILAVLNFVLPFVFIWKIGNSLNFSVLKNILACVITFLLILPSITAIMALPSLKEHRKEIRRSRTEGGNSAA